jgi:hypothetical protein
VGFTVAGRGLAGPLPQVAFSNIDSILVDLLSEYLFSDFLCGQLMIILTLFPVIDVEYAQKI